MIFFLLPGGFVHAENLQVDDPCKNAQFGCFEVLGFLFGQDNGPIAAAADGPSPTITLINKIATLVTGFIVIMGVVGIVVAGFLYMTAGGSGDRLNQAKTLIASALLGIALALTSWIILNTVSTQFTSDVIDPKDILQQTSK